MCEIIRLSFKSLGGLFRNVWNNLSQNWSSLTNFMFSCYMSMLSSKVWKKWTTAYSEELAFRCSEDAELCLEIRTIPQMHLWDTHSLTQIRIAPTQYDAKHTSAPSFRSFSEPNKLWRFPILLFKTLWISTKYFSNFKQKTLIISVFCISPCGHYTPPSILSSANLSNQQL